MNAPTSPRSTFIPAPDVHERTRMRALTSDEFPINRAPITNYDEYEARRTAIRNSWDDDEIRKHDLESGEDL